MKKTIVGCVLVISAVSSLLGCQPEKKQASVAQSSSPISSAKFVRCKDPRPQMCTREYRPVCAKKDTGVRCVKAPCPSSKEKIYATACTACSDPKVYGYVAGACQ